MTDVDRSDLVVKLKGFTERAEGGVRFLGKQRGGTPITSYTLEVKLYAGGQGQSDVLKEWELPVELYEHHKPKKAPDADLEHKIANRFSTTIQDGIQVSGRAGRVRFNQLNLVYDFKNLYPK